MRLAALKEAPYAFGSTYTRELETTEAMWRSGLASRTRFVAEVDSEVVGTVSGGPGKARNACAVTAMWVDPAFRRRGIGDVLLTTVLEWARKKRYRKVFLWVTERNDNAERLYLRHSFVRTGAAEEVLPGQREFELTRRL